MHTRLYRLDLDEQLEVSKSSVLIEQAWTQSNILIIESETGSGKSTQIPKIAIKLFGEKDSRPIAMTQPRRLATTMIAQRINEELQGQPHQFVGWQIKGHKYLSENQLLHIMTEGVLLQHLQRDLLLKKYSCIILDEIHERTISGDLICGFLKEALHKRPDLKIALLSATFGEQKWTEYFPSAKKISIGGRSFPIEDYYLPNEHSGSVMDKVLWALDHPSLPQEGNLLLFCATEGQIHEIADSVKKLRTHFVCCPLYARMNPLMQKKSIYHSTDGKQKIILSTNIAETSLTLPNISAVIDIGQEKIMMYHSTLKVLSYPIVPISQASIMQRRGRCGRTQSGRCFHLYTQEDMLSRPKERLVEIQRSSLASVYLKILSIHDKNFHHFEFISPPQENQKKEALWTLKMLNLVDERYKITELGKIILHDTLDPRFSVIMRAAQKRKIVPSIAIIVGFLSNQDPRLRPFEKRTEADQMHLQDKDLSSDFIAILNLWNRIQKKRTELSRKKFESYCHQQFLHPLYLEQWEENVRDLNQRFLPATQSPQHIIELPAAAILHEILLHGFYDRIFTKLDDGSYKGPQGIIALSPMKKQGELSPPSWLLAMTTLSYPKGLMLRYVGAIEPHSVIKLAEKYLVTQKSDWHYCPEKGAAYYHEKTLLWGLVIAGPKRKWATAEDLDGRKVAIEGIVQQAHENHFQSLEPWHAPYLEAHKIVFATHQPQVLKTLSELIDFAQKTWPICIYNRESLHKYALPHVSFKDFLSYDIGLTPKDFPERMSISAESIEFIYPDAESSFLGYQIYLSEELYQRYHPLAWIGLLPYYRRAILKNCLSLLGKKERAMIEHADEFIDLLCEEYRWPEYLWSYLNKALKDYYEISIGLNEWSIKKIDKKFLPSLWIEHADHSLSLIEAKDLEKAPPNREYADLSDPHDDLHHAYHSGLLKVFDMQSKKEIFYPVSEKMSWYGDLIEYYTQLLIQDKRLQVLCPSLSTGEEKRELLTTLLGSVISLESLPFKTQDQMLAWIDSLFKHPLIQEKNWTATLLLHLRDCKKISYDRSPDWAKPGLTALQKKKFLRHLPLSWLKKVPVWLRSAHALNERIIQKPHLAKQFSTESNEIMHAISLQSDIKLCPHSPFWALWWEWVGNTFFQPYNTITPVSGKRLIIWSEQSKMGQIKWPDSK